MELLASLAVLAAASVVVAVQILKMDIVPSNVANKYPVQTNLAVSFVASIIVCIVPALNGQNISTLDYIFVALSTPVIASITYNQLVKKMVEDKPLI